MSMLLNITASDKTEQFQLLPSQLTPYNLCTLFGLKNCGNVVLYPSQLSLVKDDNLYVVPPEQLASCTGIHLVGEDVTMPADRAQAKQKQNMMNGAKNRLLTTLKEQQQAQSAATKKENAQHDTSCMSATSVPQPVNIPRQHINPEPSPVLPKDPPLRKPPVADVEALDDVQVAPMKESKCPRCQEMVSNLVLHELQCSKFNKKCPHCTRYFDERSMGSHIAEEHTLHSCPLKGCTKQLKQGEIDDHVKNTCPQRQLPCSFCDLTFPFVELAAHQRTCGSKTEICQDCRIRVPVKDWAAHQVQCVARKPATVHQTSTIPTSSVKPEPVKKPASKPTAKMSGTTVSKPKSTSVAPSTVKATAPAGKTSVPAPKAGNYNLQELEQRPTGGAAMLMSKPNTSNDEDLARRLMQEEMQAATRNDRLVAEKMANQNRQSRVAEDRHVAQRFREQDKKNVQKQSEDDSLALARKLQLEEENKRVRREDDALLARKLQMQEQEEMDRRDSELAKELAQQQSAPPTYQQLQSYVDEDEELARRLAMEEYGENM